MEEKFDRLIDAQMDIVADWQRATRSATSPGKEVIGGDPLYHDLRLSLALAVDKLSTLVQSRNDAR